MRVGEPAPEDLTARARIRDAALRLFAEHGVVAGATIRDIAAAAGVSSGLVRHHFGSKEALRDACDAYAMDRIEQAPGGGRRRLAGSPTRPSGRRASGARVLQRYLLRSLLDGWAPPRPCSTRWSRRRRSGCGPPASRRPTFGPSSAVLCVMQVGVLPHAGQVSRALGVDV